MLACTAALFSVAALAQETQQDSTRSNTDQYRQDRQQRTEQNMDTTSMDSTSNEFRQAAEQMENEGDSLQQDATQMRDTLMQQGNDAGNQLRDDAREMRDSVRQDAEQAGNEMQQGVQQTTDQVENRVRTTRDDLRQGATRTGNQVKQGAEQATQPTQADSSSGSANQDQGSSTMTSENSGENSTPSELEVVEGKEGPNNEVVYKFNGEMWYVDRATKEMVKADESKLKDSKHKVMVHEGTTTNAKSKNNKKGKS